MKAKMTVKKGPSKITRRAGNPNAMGVSQVGFAGPKSSKTASSTKKRTVGLLAVKGKKSK